MKTKKEILKEKEEFEEVKKTVAAHKTFDEQEAGKKAEKMVETTEKMFEEEEIKEDSVLKEIVEAVIKEKDDTLLENKTKKTEKELAAEKNKWESLSSWEPKTKLGMEVKNNKITNIDEILDSGRKILEEQIVDKLLNINTDLISIGQAKGKFGGGKRRAWRQTQKKTEEGNVPTFSTMAVIGDEAGHFGIGDGKAKETLPARDKAIRKAKLNIIKIKRGCSAFDCSCNEAHSIPFKVAGKSGSVKVTLIPAPQGTGLVVAKELKKMLKLAGIKDVYSKTFGSRRTTFNLIKAGFDALKKTNTKK